MFSLDDIRIASPCRSDWDSMYGDDRRRFCAECKLNVYNLSGMTRDEAERLVMNSEGRLCVRFFRRKDGTILTQDCLVGWKAVKKRVSRMAVALSSIIAGFLTGVFSLRAVDSAISLIPVGDVPSPVVEKASESNWVVGEVPDEGLPMAGRVVLREPQRIYNVGRVSSFDRLEDAKVKVWMK